MTCDICSKSDVPTFFGCRQCSIDICSSCIHQTRQDEIDCLPRNRIPPRQQEPRQACCMMAVAERCATEPERLTAAARGERYNRRRPSYQGNHVSLHDYPDPTFFGWTFTGSCQSGRAEFFEKAFPDGTVKMDFYYTTGTVKTVLDHPHQGVTQLFAHGSQLTPEEYQNILRNPRFHTGHRYHCTDQRNYGY